MSDSHPPDFLYHFDIKKNLPIFTIQGKHTFASCLKEQFAVLKKKTFAMEKEIINKSDAVPLRQKAEEQLKSKASPIISETDALKLVHELQVHQIELEMQNEELILAKEKAEFVEQRYTELYDFAPSGYLTLSKEGVILELNFAAARMLGKERSYLVKTTFSKFISADTRTAFNLFFQKVFESEAKETCELILVSDDNSPIYMHIDGIVNENREQCLITLVDITERKQAETLLERRNEELIIVKEKAEESDRLKTAFLQNMSHEIRTPMNAIIGFSSRLNKPDLSDEKRKSFTSIIIDSANQLLSIVSDILTISSLETKQEKLNPGKVCINNIIADLLAIFKTQAFNQNITLLAKQQLTHRQSEIYTDNTKVTQILTNLITNALKFTNEGFIEFGYKLKDTELEFYVKDTGIGIEPQKQVKIFDRFVQADKTIQLKYGGTGLGLSICKGFVELLDGKIWVQSAPEKGSTFYFTIPYKPVHEVDRANS